MGSIIVYQKTWRQAKDDARRSGIYMMKYHTEYWENTWLLTTDGQLRQPAVSGGNPYRSIAGL
jgi:hypothetical protein